MAFKVTYTNGPPTEHGDQDAYEFLDRGILKITESSGKTFYYVLDIWNSLVAEPGHGPGVSPNPVVPPNPVH
jgi:hypothetical protein